MTVLGLVRALTPNPVNPSSCSPVAVVPPVGLEPTQSGVKARSPTRQAPAALRLPPGTRTRLSALGGRCRVRWTSGRCDTRESNPVRSA